MIRSSQFFRLSPKIDYFHVTGVIRTFIFHLRTASSWGFKPINLGATINTPFGERTPWLSDDGMTLYFSSDGHWTWQNGCIQIYKIKRIIMDGMVKPENLGRLLIHLIMIMDIS